MHDRLCRLAVDYQDEDAERGIVALRTDAAEGDRLPRLIADAVAVTRATRVHPDIRQGSSVRGAIDCVLVARQLADLRGITSDDASDRSEAAAYPAMMLDAMTVALSGRIHLDEAAETTPEAVLREIWEDHFILTPAMAEPG